MTDFLKPSFSSRPASPAYRANYDKVFGKKKKTKPRHVRNPPDRADVHSDLEDLDCFDGKIRKP